MLRLINKIVDFQFDNQEPPASKDRDYYLAKMCGILPRDLCLSALRGNRLQYQKESETDTMIAAMSANGNTALLRKALEHCCEKMNHSSDLFGNPLIKAVKRRDIEQVQLILGHIEATYSMEENKRCQILEDAIDASIQRTTMD